jgi:glycine/D-amino acid oxidase-like deaminating enzyme
MYGQANQVAVQQVTKIIRSEKIDAGWTTADNYVFTTEVDQIKKIKKEAEIAAKLGLPATFEKSTPLPFDVQAAIKFSGQANIHAQKYIDGLAKAVQGGGSYVFEHSNVIDIRDRKRPKVRTRKGSVIAKHVIVATNVPTFPLVARGGYCLLEYPTESYIVAASLDQKIEGMYISPDKGEYSILPVRHRDDYLLLIGGEGHISGMRTSKKARYRKLANYAEERFAAKSIEYCWSDRDYMSYDSVPLVGKLYPWSRNVYVATAFQKWGLTNGTVAAMILHDKIMKRPNPWATVFDSSRIRPIKSIPRVAAKYLTGD